VRQNLAYGGGCCGGNPGFTIVAVLTLALGIGANIATFSVVHAVVLRPLPYPEPERLVRVFDDLQGADTKDVECPCRNCGICSAGPGCSRTYRFIWPISENLTGGEHPQRTESGGDQRQYFTMLGAHSQLGRLYEPQDAVPGFTDGVVISDGFWKRVFGGGRRRPRVRLDSDLYTIRACCRRIFVIRGNPGNGNGCLSASGLSGPLFLQRRKRAQRILPGGTRG